MTDFTIDQVSETRGAWTLAAAHGRGRDVELASSGRIEDAAVVARLEALRIAPRRPADLALALPVATGHDSTSFWIARPVLAEGATLADRLADGPLERNEALRVLSLVAGAIDTLAAWALPAPLPTPERIGLAKRSPAQPMLYDYGIPPAATDVAADADYLAPERAAGGAATTASNVYALACVLVECLTGAPPFPYDMPALVLNAHRTEPPPRIAAATGLPEQLDRVLQTALDKRPEQRQQSAAGLMHAAQRALGHRRFPTPVLAAPPRPKAARTPKTHQPSPRATAATPPRRAASPRATSPSRRRRLWPAPSGVGIAAVLLLASTAGYATATSGPDHPASSADRAAPPSVLSTPPAGANAAGTTALARTMDRLGTERAAARAQLRAARHPGAQAAAATRLATAYREARRALPPPAVLAAVGPLDPALAGVQRAYHRLATTARTGDAAAFRHVATKIAQREAALDATLKSVTGQA
jgi:hypothetical protein